MRDSYKSRIGSRKLLDGGSSRKSPVLTPTCRALPLSHSGLTGTYQHAFDPPIRHPNSPLMLALTPLPSPYQSNGLQRQLQMRSTTRTEGVRRRDMVPRA